MIRRVARGCSATAAVVKRRGWRLVSELSCARPWACVFLLSLLAPVGREARAQETGDAPVSYRAVDPAANSEGDPGADFEAGTAEGADADSEKDAADQIAEFFEKLGPPGSRRPFRYYYVPPVSDADGAARPGDGGEPPAPKKTIDLTVTANAYDPADPDAYSPKKVFDRFLTEVVETGVREGQHGDEARRAIHEGPWGDELIKATLAVLDPNGDNSPKAVKQLIKRGDVTAEHARLMWMARDLLIRRAKTRVHAALKARHPGMSFDIAGLDSGSYESVGSDVDKTLHVTAWDAKGKQVKAFGEGGMVFRGDVEAFLRMVVSEFNAVGNEIGATHPIAKSMDVEFFSSATLPERFPGRLGRGATHSSTESVINRVAEALRRNFAALQENPGPAYQFRAKVIAQVIGRAVEQDVLLKQRIAQLNRLRENLDQLSAADQRGLFLDEMLTSTHAAAVIVTEEDGVVVIRPIDVIEFLERNNLATAYDADMAAGNALGDYEKLSHYREKVIDAEGVFLREKYGLYRDDFAKYISRLALDMATYLFADTDPGKPAAFGDFNRRFGAADARERFNLAHDPPNLREYTRDVHRALFEPVLERLHARTGFTPEARQQIETDLELFWRSQRVAETIMAIKNDPDLANTRYPPQELYGELVQHIEENDPGRFGDLSGLNEAEIAQRKIEAAQRLHVEAGERAGAELGGGYQNLALDRWLGSDQVSAEVTLRSEQAKLQRLKTSRDRLMRRLTQQGTEEAAARQRELQALHQKVEDVSELVRWMQANPADMVEEARNSGREMARRMFELFQRQSLDPNFARMMELVEPRYRSDLLLMWKVWTVQAAEAERNDLARRIGVDLSRMGTWSRDAGRRLGYSYAEAFGVDTRAWFHNRAAGPAAAGDPNAPGRILGRFFRRNYLETPLHAAGWADSGLRLIRTMQLSRGMPWEQRMSLFAESLTTEMIMPVPAIGPIYLTWKGYQSGDPKAIAGGVINGAQEVAQLWMGVSAPSLEVAMTQAGYAGRAAMLSELSFMGPAAAILLSMARTSVEIVGHEAFEPVRDHYFQLAYKGYVDPQEAGVIRAGSERADSRIPVTPIIEPGGPGAFQFVYLKPRLAQMYLDDLRAVGENDAAVELLRLAGLDENLDSGFDPAGTCGKDNPAACPVLIDLETDFDALIAGASARELDPGRLLPPHLADRAELLRRGVIDMWRGLASLQRVTRNRISQDREVRQRVPDHLNLWLLAARENLGLYLDAGFQRQAELLYQRLLFRQAGMSDVAQVLADEAEEAWQRWQAQAPSFEDPERIRQQFLQVMSPRVIYDQRLAAIKERAETVGDVPWGMPDRMLTEYLARAGRRWLERESEEDIQRRLQAEALERQTAAMYAFTDNLYVRQAGRSPTAPYTLAGATRWYAQEMGRLRQAIRGLFDPDQPVPEGRALVDLLIPAQDSLARLEEEYQLVMQGFSEIDAVVAPKIAQLLLMDWIGASGSFDTDEHLALDFLWQDAATQQQIRRKITDDMIRGRRLIPRYRAQAAAYAALLDAELRDIYVEYVRLAEDALKQRLRESLRLAEALADARKRPEVFPGEIELHVEPYIVDGDGASAVIVDTRVDHEIYRAVDVEVETNSQVVPFDRIADIVGREAYDRALQWTGLEEEEVLFAVRVDAKVTKADPPPGYDSLRYESLPETTGHLLLVPGRVEQTEPVLEEPALAVLPQSEADVLAGVSVSPEEAHLHLDTGLERPFIYDDLWLFFTPKRDLAEAFGWRVVGAEGDTIAGAIYDPDNEEFSSTLLAGEGAPGKFVRKLHLWGTYGWSGPAEIGVEAGPGSGTYTLETCDVVPLNGRVFGQASGWEFTDTCEEEGSFEAFATRFYYQGFVIETGKLPYGDDSRTFKGTVGLVPPVNEGENVVLGIEAKWKERASLEDDWATAARHTAGGRLTLTFPPELDPQTTVLGEITAELKLPGEEVTDTWATEVELHSLVPAERKPPDRELVAPEDEDEDVEPLGWIHIPQFDEVETPFTFSWFVGADAVENRWLAGPEGSKTMHLHIRLDDEVVGQPARLFSRQVRKGEVLWYLPVRLALGGHSLYGFAVYGSRPGTYDGPSPTAPGSVGGGEDGDGAGDPAGANDAGEGGEGEGGGGGDAGDAGDGPGGDPGGPPPVVPGAGGPVDPAGLDPGDPEIAGHIRAWIQVAEPPQNVTERANFTYNHRGVLIGTSADGGIMRAPHDEPLAFDATFLWVNKRRLDSVDHCTLEEYVVAQLEAASIDHCRGRYTAPPAVSLADVTGLRAGVARDRLVAEGFKVTVQVAREATAERDTFTVFEQKPAARSEVVPGSEVELLIYGGYHPLVSVPDVTRLSASAARDTLTRLGLETIVTIGAEATSETIAYQVYEHMPWAGRNVEPETEIELFVYGPYNPLVTVPDVTGHTAGRADSLLTGLGLVARRTEAGSAPSRGLAGTVGWTTPLGGSEVEPGFQVEVAVYSRYVDPQCDDLVARGRTARGAVRIHEALDLYRQARQLACPVPGLIDTIADLETDVREWERCEVLIKRGNTFRQNGQNRETLDLYRQARDLGCTNPGLDNSIADLVRVIRQEEAGARCDALVNQGNAVRGSGDDRQALNIYRQAMQLGCTNPGLVGTIADLDSSIQRQEQCNGLLNQGTAAYDAAQYSVALELYQTARAQNCTAPWLDGTIADAEARIAEGDTRRAGVWRRSGPVVDPPGQRHEFGWAERGERFVNDVIVGASNMQTIIQFVSGGQIRKDVRFRIDFDLPPEEIRAGTRLVLRLQGSTDSRQGPGVLFAEVVYAGIAGEGIPILAQARIAFDDQRPLLTIDYQVPENLPDEFRIRVEMGGVKMVWTYRRVR